MPTPSRKPHAAYTVHFEDDGEEVSYTFESYEKLIDFLRRYADYGGFRMTMRLEWSDDDERGVPAVSKDLRSEAGDLTG